MTTTHKDTDLREALRRRYASTPQLPDNFADRLMQHTGKPKRRHPWWLYAAIGAAASIAVLLIKAPEAHEAPEAPKAPVAHKAPPSAPEGATIDFPRLTAHKTIEVHEVPETHETHKAHKAHKAHEAHKAPPSAPEGATIDFPRLTAHKTIDRPRPTARKTIVAPSGAEGGASGALGVTTDRPYLTSRKTIVAPSGAEGGALEAFRQEATAIRERGEQLMHHVATLSELPAERMEYVEF